MGRSTSDGVDLIAALIPEGPLHPDDALFAFVVGVVVGVGLRFAGRLGGYLAPVGALVVLEVRYPGTIWPSVDGRWAAIAACVAAATLIAAPLRAGAAEIAARPLLAGGIVTVGGVWAIVPDTEAALIGGCVFAGLLVFGRAAWGRLAAASVAIVPTGAALVGSVGRPERLWPALGLVLAVSALGWLSVPIVRRQRAGTPTTVDPGATSAVTTAPAPTTAP